MRDEDAHRRRFEGQQRHHVELDLMADGVPGIDDDQDGQEGGQPDEEHADAIHRQVIADAQARESMARVRRTAWRPIGNESHEHENAKGQLHERDRQGRSADHVFVVEQPQHGGPDEREERADRRESETWMSSSSNMVSVRSTVA